MTDEATLPPINPSLIQNSLYPAVHFDSGQTDVTSLPAWTVSAKIDRSEVAWLPSVPFIDTARLPYPDGEQALFISGTSPVFRSFPFGEARPSPSQRRPSPALRRGRRP